MSFSSGLQRSSSTNATCDECSSPRSEWNEEFDRGLTQLMHDNLYCLDMPECFKHKVIILTQCWCQTKMRMITSPFYTYCLIHFISKTRHFADVWLHKMWHIKVNVSKINFALTFSAVINKIVENLRGRIIIFDTHCIVYFVCIYCMYYMAVNYCLCCVVALQTGGVLSLPKMLVDPRRPEVMSPEARWATCHRLPLTFEAV